MSIETKIFKFTLWLFSACFLLGLVTGCSPYTVAETTPAQASMEAGQQTASSPAPKSPTGWTFTPASYYWQLATARPPRLRIDPAFTGGKIDHYSTGD